MARVTIETVEQMARLARLALTREECASYARQLEQVLEYADSIQKLDISDVPPMSHAGTASVLREDVEASRLPREVATAAASDADDGLFRVPRVIPG
jgi:aspartyl-tRNA(Asn)/glutamyl-tRNA(Gln) amidotransferase subunit C